jgi:hypothetical protein
MSKRIMRCADFSGKQFDIEISSHPDSCLECKHSIEPIFLSSYLIKEEGRGRSIAVVFQCPREDCRTIFVGRYQKHISSDAYYLTEHYILVHTKSPSWPEIVESISPVFSRTYAQANVAELNGLDQVCGPGYRRALEFLVKDYLIHCGDDETTVRRLWLGTCVSRIKDERIKATAERATWLGNDQTHYERTWENHDIDSLKALIRLTAIWIESEELTKRFRDEMPGA